MKPKINVKKAQTAAYMIIGLAIAVSFLLLFTANKNDASKMEAGIEKTKIDDKNIVDFVQFCIDKTAKDAVFYLGFVGGNLRNDAFPKFYTIDSFYRIPYYYYEEKPLILSEDGFKSLILAKYVNENLRKCTNNFKAFENVRIVDSNPNANVELSDNGAIFNVSYPVSINRGFQTKKLDQRYITEVKVRLKGIIEIAQTIVTEESKNDRIIHWDFLTEASNRNYNITAYTENDNTIIYRIIDLENEIDNEPYIFQWANKIKLRK